MNSYRKRGYRKKKGKLTVTNRMLLARGLRNVFAEWSEK